MPESLAGEKGERTPPPPPVEHANLDTEEDLYSEGNGESRGSSDSSPPSQLFSGEPSVLILEATLVEKPPEIPVYHGVQVPDEEQGSCWRRYH